MVITDMKELKRQAEIDFDIKLEKDIKEASLKDTMNGLKKMYR